MLFISAFIPGFSRLDSPGGCGLPRGGITPSLLLTQFTSGPGAQEVHGHDLPQDHSPGLTQVVFHFGELLLVQPLQLLDLDPQPANL